MRPRRGRVGALLGGAAACLATALGLLVLAAWLTARPGDPDLYPARGPDGRDRPRLPRLAFRAGAPRAALTGPGSGPALADIAVRFRAYPEIEFGWGEARFYRATPTLAEFDVRLALRALFTPGGRDGVVQVVGLERPARASFPMPRSCPCRSRRPASHAYWRGSRRAFASRRAPHRRGPGLYGPSLFYEGAGRFSYANVCNHWAARLLAAAGLPVTPVLDTHPAGLILDLRWRAGLAPLPANLSKP